METQLIQVAGEDLVCGGKKIVLRGFGLGSWMNIEHFMFGIPGTEQMMRNAFAQVYGRQEGAKFFDDFLTSLIQEEDFKFIKELGVNVLRLAVNYRHFDDDLHPGEYREEGFRHIDRVLALCEKYKIYAIIDIHTAPGGQNPDWHADSDLGVPLFWDQVAQQNRIVGLWRFIARHLQGNPWVAGYDLLNEPNLVPDVKVFNEFFDKTIAAIREVDNDHVIFLEGDDWAKDFSLFHMPQDPQTAYSFHLYPGHYVQPTPGMDYKKVLTSALAPLFAIRDRFHRPIWCGETGIGYEKDRAMENVKIMRAMLDLLEENDTAWTIWAYKDSGRLSLVYPKTDTDWSRFIKQFKEVWDLRNETKIAHEVLDFLADKKYIQPVEEKLKYSVQFRLRGIFHTIYVEQYLKPALQKIPWQEMKEYPKSFLWQNCQYWPEMAELIKSYTK